MAPDLLVPGGDNVEVPWPWHERIDAEEDSLDTSIVDQLVPMLAAATSTSTRCHYGLWQGFGEFNSGSTTMVYTSNNSPWGRWRQRRTQSVHGRRTDATLTRPGRSLSTSPSVALCAGGGVLAISRCSTEASTTSARSGVRHCLRTSMVAERSIAGARSGGGQTIEPGS